MQLFHHLREQSPHAVVDELLEVRYRVLFTQVQPEFILHLLKVKGVGDKKEAGLHTRVLV